MAKGNGASYDVYCSLVSAEARLNGVFSGLCDKSIILRVFNKVSSYYICVVIKHNLELTSSTMDGLYQETNR